MIETRALQSARNTSASSAPPREQTFFFGDASAALSKALARHEKRAPQSATPSGISNTAPARRIKA